METSAMCLDMFIGKMWKQNIKSAFLKKIKTFLNAELEIT